jgi:hypothetical protein
MSMYAVMHQFSAIINKTRGSLPCSSKSEGNWKAT